MVLPEFRDRRDQASRIPEPASDMAGRRIAAGLFLHVDAASGAVRALKASGFTDKEIRLTMRDRTDQGRLPVDTGETGAGEEAARGAIGGGLLGALVGLLVGLGVVVIPGLGPLIAGGALASALGVAG
ncbi:MAG: hypothetical protein C4294_12345, partial [Nitrospiraceae bacterium]